MKKCMCCFKETDTYVVKIDSKNQDLILCNECDSLFFNEFQEYEMEILLPNEIKNKLDKSVIGQEYAKKILSFEIYRHLLRVKNSNFVELNKGNIMLIGPSGTGKTLLIKTLSEIVKLPFIEVDITSYTQVGYVGLNVSNIIKNLLKEANGDVKLTEFGIVFIDEIDKIAKRNVSNDSKDVSGEGVQQNLLKMLEGTVVRVQNDDSEIIEVNTKNILFIGGGAFTGIEEQVRNRIMKKTVGFNENKESDNESVEKDNLRKYVKIEDVINYGILSEFVGRFPLIIPLNSLSKEELISIAKIEIKREIVNYFTLIGKRVKISDKSIENIVFNCLNHPLGARAIRTNIHDMFKDSLYEFVILDEKEIEI